MFSLNRDKVAMALKDNLYIFNCNKMNRVEMAAFAKFLWNQNKFSIWHCHLRHLNVKHIKDIEAIVSRLNLGSNAINIACKGCIQGK